MPRAQCGTCWGDGTIQVVVEVACSVCNGVGKKDGKVCTLCNGRKKFINSKKITCPQCHGDGEVDF